jgi:hypothetical protein
VETIPNRIVIYTKDIKNITGRKETAARNLIAKIRKKYNKEAGSFITVFEFCEYTGLKPENVTAFLNN